jgi:hypothetical protein
MGRKEKRRLMKSPSRNTSFEELVSNATTARYKGLIKQEIDQLGQELAGQQADTLTKIYTRLVVLEKIVIEKLGVTQEDMASRIADAEDAPYGLQVVDTAEKGDRVRVQFAGKPATDAEYTKTSNTMINNIGSGGTFGKEIEDAIVGMKTDETKEITVGEAEKAFNVKITVNRISRQPKPATPELPKEETSADASPNA